MTTEYLNNKFFEGVISKFRKLKKDKLKYQMIIDDLQTSLRCRSAREPELDHSELNRYQAIYAATVQEFKYVEDQLARAFLKLSENLVRYAKSIISDSDDAIQEGVMICFAKIDLFDSRKGAAFNYMTTCILNHFRQRYRTEVNYKRLINEKFFNHLLSQLSGVFVKNGREMYNAKFSED